MNLHRLSILLLSLVFISSFAQKAPKKSGWRKFKSLFKHEIKKDQTDQKDMLEEREQVVDQKKLEGISDNDEVVLELGDAIQQEQVMPIDQQEELEIVEEVELDDRNCEKSKTDELQEVCDELIVVKDLDIYFAWLKSKKRWFIATGLVVFSGIDYYHNKRLVLFEWICKGVGSLDDILNKEKKEKTGQELREQEKKIDCLGIEMKYLEDKLEFLENDKKNQEGKDSSEVATLKEELSYFKEEMSKFTDLTSGEIPKLTDLAGYFLGKKLSRSDDIVSGKIR